MDDKLVRLSDALDAVYGWVGVTEKDLEGVLALQIEADLLNLPAVDAVDVRHGHWVTEEEAIEKDDYSLRDTCSVCGHCDWDCTESESFNFCPNCGAKMDGKEKN